MKQLLLRGKINTPFPILCSNPFTCGPWSCCNVLDYQSWGCEFDPMPNQSFSVDTLTHCKLGYKVVAMKMLSASI